MHIEMEPNVLLVHGVLMNPLEMRYLGRHLKKNGFKVHYVYYQSVLKNSIENANHLHNKIKQLPDLHIVAHSLGGIIVMHLLNQFEDIPCGRVVMLGSPVQGSLLAKKMARWPLAGLLLRQSMPNALSGNGIPYWNTDRNWGMIAGSHHRGLGFLVGGLPGENDGTVMVEETRHPQQTDHITLNVSHSGLLFSARVAQLTTRFLRFGKFEP